VLRPGLRGLPGAEVAAAASWLSRMPDPFKPRPWVILRGRFAVPGPSPLPRPASEIDGARMAWFFRVIERDDGRWACRRGGQEYDTHATVTPAIDHIRSLAGDQLLAELYLHRIDGSIERIDS
jgi:hypothetical protein